MECCSMGRIDAVWKGNGWVYYSSTVYGRSLIATMRQCCAMAFPHSRYAGSRSFFVALFSRLSRLKTTKVIISSGLTTNANCAHAFPISETFCVDHEIFRLLF